MPFGTFVAVLSHLYQLIQHIRKILENTIIGKGEVTPQ